MLSWDSSYLTFYQNAKDSQILSTKNNSVFVILPFEILKKRYLTMLLILNNWAQADKSVARLMLVKQ